MKKIGSHGHHTFFTFDFEGEEQRIDVQQMTKEDLEEAGITEDMLKDMVESLANSKPVEPVRIVYMNGIWYERGDDGVWREQEWIEEEEDGADQETEDTHVQRERLD